MVKQATKEQITQARALLQQATSATTYESRKELIRQAYACIKGCAPIKKLDAEVWHINHRPILIDGVPLPRPWATTRKRSL